jgi:hypothetical protein
MVVRGQIALACGDVRAAVTDATAALAAARAIGDPEHAVAGLAFAARAHARSGQLRQASELWRELVEDGARLFAPLANILLWSAGVAWAAAEMECHEDLRGVSRFAGVVTPWYEALEAVAERRYVDAAAIYGRLGSMPDEAYARLLAGEALVGEGRHADADAQLRQASEAFRSLGASAYLVRATQVLSRSA